MPHIGLHVQEVAVCAAGSHANSGFTMQDAGRFRPVADDMEDRGQGGWGVLQQVGEVGERAELCGQAVAAVVARLQAAQPGQELDGLWYLGEKVVDEGQADER